MGTTKRRLPVLKSGPAVEDDARPPWHWVLFGTAMIFTVWLPLAYVGTAILARAEGARITPVVALLVPLVVASAAGGFLVGRFGKPAGLREAVLAGVVTGLVAVGLTAISGAFSPLFVVVIAMTGACAGAGGALGVRQRPA
jgi:tRNA-(ms[2]io[6]A)-hydroxylase